MKISYKNVRILLCDDHSVLREGIISLLKSEKDLLIVGEAENGLELIDKYFKLKPDIIITDIKMPEMSGTEAVKKIKEKDPDAKALFLSMYEGTEYIYYTYKAGGSGLINKNIVKGELVYAIRKILSGELYFGAEIEPNDLEEIVRNYEETTTYYKDIQNNYNISDREAEILKLIGDGITSGEIAEKLGLSKRTIDTHRAHLLQKLKLKGLPSLIRFAVSFSQSQKKNELH
jgi:DNA-binding NarL/FixJ family response regulator